jgi:hypothetical protein
MIYAVIAERLLGNSVFAEPAQGAVVTDGSTLPETSFDVRADRNCIVHGFGRVPTNR